MQATAIILYFIIYIILYFTYLYHATHWKVFNPGGKMQNGAYQLLFFFLINYFIHIKQYFFLKSDEIS